MSRKTRTLGWMSRRRASNEIQVQERNRSSGYTYGWTWVSRARHRFPSEGSRFEITISEELRDCRLSRLGNGAFVRVASANQIWRRCNAEESKGRKRHDLARSCVSAYSVCSCHAASSYNHGVLHRVLMMLRIHRPRIQRRL